MYVDKCCSVDYQKGMRLRTERIMVNLSPELKERIEFCRVRDSRTLSLMMELLALTALPIIEQQLGIEWKHGKGHIVREKKL